MDKKSGFFINFHETIDISIDDVTRNNFANLETNAQRVSYLFSLPAIKDYDLSRDVEKCQAGGDFPVKKDLDKARQLKNDGNEAVRKGDWFGALQMYSQSLIHMPTKESDELSIVFANRSAALNHLEQHEEALADIRRCLELGYPRHLRYKAFERKARCLLVLKRNKEALIAFQDTISALSEATKLQKEKRQKMHTDARLMIEMLNKGLKLAGNPHDPEPSKKILAKPKLSGKTNAQYPALSEAVNIEQDNEKGRYAIATRDITVGETLLVERPFSGVLLAEYSKTHCQNCFMKCPVPLACPRCPNVIFCSDKCLQLALKSYHSYECHILPLLWKSECSITCHIALRMITQNKKEYFVNINKDLENESKGTYKSDDYKNVYHLVAHEDKRTKKDFLHRTQMAVFLVKLLEISGYFDGQVREKFVEMDEIKSMAIHEKYKSDVGLLGGLILRNLQVLQFNAHEVFELQCLKPKVGTNLIKHKGKSTFLAGALFSTLSLFNHSCDPSIVRYFVGPSVVVRAIKTIKKGEEVAENYGPIFTTVPKEKRQETLKGQYWFHCKCIPCEDNWPTYDQMTENYMRFKCDSDNACPNVIPVPHDCKDFMMQCSLCHQHTNILKGLKSLQDTDMIYRLGRAALEEGKYGEAKNKFIELLKLYDTTLAPPYKSYYDCVQELRNCMLAMGNYSII